MVRPAGRLLMTGATGYLGRHLLARLLRDGWQARVLLRAPEQDPWQRLTRALTNLPLPPPADWQSQVEILTSQAESPNWGLSAMAITHLAGWADLFLHAAGLTRLDDQAAEAVERVNGLGTQHAWHLARALGIRRFHHTSTVFVAGRHRGPFGPGDEGGDFHCPYERSKWQAEQWLLARHASMDQVVIHRPAILVGGKVVDEQGTTPTLYTFLKALRFFKACHLRGALHQGTCHLPLRVAGDPAAGLDLVLVTAVADEMAASLRQAPPGWSIRHHVSGLATPLARIRDAFSQSLALTGVELVPEEAFVQLPRTPVEERLHRATRSFAPYLWPNPRFLPDGQRPTGLGAPGDLPALAREFLQAWSQDPAGEDNLAAMALDLLEVRDAATFFQRFAAGELGTGFFRQNSFVEARVRFHVTGPPDFDQVLHLARGTASLLPGTDEADCGFHMTAGTFLDIVRSRLDARQAFFQGRITLTGDKERGLKIAFLLAEFFRQAPERTLAEITA